MPDDRLEASAEKVLGKGLSLIDDRWLYFVQVAALGSLSKAAVVLDVPQSVVSRNIAVLESQCGERLFHRTGRGVLLTEFGEYLHPRILEFHSRAGELADEIRSMRGTLVGEVLVGLLPSAVIRLAGPLSSAVKSRMPGIRLHLAEGSSAQLQEQLQDGRLDMAVVLCEDPSSIGSAHVLAELPLHLVGMAGDPILESGDITLEDCSGLPLVIPSRPHLLRARLDYLVSEYFFDLQVAIEADSLQVQKEVVKVGGGYAIASVIPDTLDPRLRSARIVDPILKRYVILADSPRRQMTKASRAVWHLIADLGVHR